MAWPSAAGSGKSGSAVPMTIRYGGPFADVIGGAACATHHSHCDLSRGVVTNDAANTVTFHLVAPNPEFLDRLTLPDAYAVPADTPLHDIGLHPLPATGPYKWVVFSRYSGWLVRNPYFHEWSHAARPDGYPDKIVWSHVASWDAGITAVERGSADFMWDGVPQDRLNEAQARYAGQFYVTPTSGTTALFLNTRRAPFTDLRVRRAINYAIDRAKVAQLLGHYSQPACQIFPVGLPGYRRYCRYTTEPNPSGAWHAPNVAQAQRLISASGTRGTTITIWNLEANHDRTLDAYLVSLLDRLGFPTRVKDFSTLDTSAALRFADSRTSAQAALLGTHLISRTRPRPRCSKPTSRVNRSRRTHPATQTGRSSATTESTPRSTTLSPRRATTRLTPQRYGHRPTGPLPTKPQPSRLPR